MTTRLNPYLGFRDNAREAMEFYQTVLGGDLTVTTFAEFNASEDPAEQNKVMHAQLINSTGLTLMGADTPNSMEYNPGDNYSVSISGEDEAELRGYWEKVSVGANITAPFERAPWGDIFGMCTDKFGVNWLINVTTVP